MNKEFFISLIVPCIALVYIFYRYVKSRKAMLSPGILYDSRFTRADVHEGKITKEQADDWLRQLADCYVTYTAEHFALSSQTALRQFYDDYQALSRKGLVSSPAYEYLAKGEHKDALATLGCIG